MARGVNKPGLTELLTRLFEQGQQLARAEVRLAKQKIYDRVRRARTAALLLLAAFVLVQAGVVALLVGLVMALAKVTGPAWAGVILLAIGLALAGLLAFAAYRLILSERARRHAEHAKEAP